MTPMKTLPGFSFSRGLVLALALLSCLAAGGTADSAPGWITTWTTSNAATDRPAAFSNQTIRQTVHTTIGGSAVRLRLANTFGTHAIRFDAVYIGLQQNGPSLVPHSNHPVTFGGNPWIAIPEGAEALSDPVPLATGAQQNLAISLFTSADTGPATVHGSAMQTNYLSAAGNFASQENGDAFGKTTTSWYFLSAVEVLASSKAQGAIVALGDSITDGASARFEKNERWTDVLARRLLAQSVPIAVLNAGIGGNRVLTSSPCWGENALARLDRDVLSLTGVTAVILFEGTNDIGQPDTKTQEPNPCLSRTPVSADEIIAGYKQIIARADARGLKILGATILPYQGFGGWTAQGDAKRNLVNQWIRTSGAFAGVIDFDAALRDPSAPARLAPRYDSGDHLHPGPAGHEAMGNQVNLALLREGRTKDQPTQKQR